MSDKNRGDDYYNRYPDQYDFADEIGWINRNTGEVVEAHGGYGGRAQREADEEFYREERRRERRGW
jgi:hypothetical protein